MAGQAPGPGGLPAAPPPGWGALEPAGGPQPELGPPTKPAPGLAPLAAGQAPQGRHRLGPGQPGDRHPRLQPQRPTGRPGPGQAAPQQPGTTRGQQPPGPSPGRPAGPGRCRPHLERPQPRPPHDRPGDPGPPLAAGPDHGPGPGRGALHRPAPGAAPGWARPLQLQPAAPGPAGPGRTLASPAQGRAGRLRELPAGRPQARALERTAPGERPPGRPAPGPGARLPGAEEPGRRPRPLPAQPGRHEQR